MAKVIATEAQIKVVSQVWFEFNPLGVEGDDKAFAEAYASFISKSLDHLTRGRPATFCDTVYLQARGETVLRASLDHPPPVVLLLPERKSAKDNNGYLRGRSYVLPLKTVLS